MLLRQEEREWGAGTNVVESWHSYLWRFYGKCGKRFHSPLIIAHDPFPCNLPVTPLLSPPPHPALPLTCRSLNAAETRVGSAARAWNFSVQNQVYAENNNTQADALDVADGGRAVAKRRRVMRKVQSPSPLQQGVWAV